MPSWREAGTTRGVAPNCPSGQRNESRPNLACCIFSILGIAVEERVITPDVGVIPLFQRSGLTRGVWILSWQEEMCLGTVNHTLARRLAIQLSDLHLVV